MMLLGSMSHPNLLPYVACNYDEDGLLITNFAINGSVASHLHDVSRRWDMRNVFEKIQGLRETENEEEFLSDSSEE
uniref:Pollen receptor-like kinase 4 n=1 Tax=Tanacetum cinerariifolium TaxID=118510 RepID=A0A6L2N8T2_TANCI|nr:pollen receptor-like kinase 4 [Tanacetum cinerariifolium]